MSAEPDEIDLDVCPWCFDSECNGVACIGALDPENPVDQDRITQLHQILVAGRRALYVAWQRCDACAGTGRQPHPLVHGDGVWAECHECNGTGAL